VILKILIVCCIQNVYLLQVVGRYLIVIFNYINNLIIYIYIPYKFEILSLILIFYFWKLIQITTRYTYTCIALVLYISFVSEFFRNYLKATLKKCPHHHGMNLPLSLELSEGFWIIWKTFLENPSTQRSSLLSLRI